MVFLGFDRGVTRVGCRTFASFCKELLPVVFARTRVFSSLGWLFKTSV